MDRRIISGGAFVRLTVQHVDIQTTRQVQRIIQRKHELFLNASPVIRTAIKHPSAFCWDEYKKKTSCSCTDSIEFLSLPTWKSQKESKSKKCEGAIVVRNQFKPVWTSWKTAWKPDYDQSDPVWRLSKPVGTSSKRVLILFNTCWNYSEQSKPVSNKSEPKHNMFYSMSKFLSQSKLNS